jgi:hypothetical protein
MMEEEGMMVSEGMPHIKSNRMSEEQPSGAVNK